ncbi:MAG TPA: xanthine dehydrogenase family protein molybdopterin-binding subunit, partial [Beijerinckiaceae bacterium]|nr:xanthine dehydrogenase family protein molybdopterin-binding subunit [Beijerinckiaceae bacterium]
MTKQFKGRREDLRLVSGRGCFASDWSFPEETYGCFLRSDRAHAEVVSVDIAQALRSPGVLAVLTGEDTKAAGFGAVPQLVRFPGKGGQAIKVPRREVLAETRVRFIGQEVALVVATSEQAAQDALEKVVVSYRDLPVVVDAEAALSPGAPELYPDSVPGNLSFDYEYGEETKTQEAFARAAHVTRVTVTAQRLAGTPMEPKAALARYDAESGVYDLYAPTQGMTLMSASLSGGTGIPESHIRVHARDVGGGFGVRSEGYSEYCALMLAAKIVGRSVKWIGSRSETIVSDHHGRDAKMTGELALDAQGRFLAARFLWIVNCGGYLSGAGPFINTLPPAGHSVNLYKIPLVHGLHRLALTNTTPTTAYRGAARPNVSYLVERLVDEAAHEMRIDPVELRRRNFIRKEEFPYTAPPLGFVYDSGDPIGLLEDALRHSDWSGYSRRQALSASRGKLRGRGLAAFIEPAGGGGSPQEEVAIKFGESGNPILYSVSGPSGQ